MRKRNYWLAIGLLLTVGAAGASLCICSLRAFGSPEQGDYLSTTSPSTVAGAGIVLVALLTRIGLELVDASSRRRPRSASGRTHDI
jgi:hypothetical protein